MRRTVELGGDHTLKVDRRGEAPPQYEPFEEDKE